MAPDYPSKIFYDQRNDYVFLTITLSADAIA